MYPIPEHVRHYLEQHPGAKGSDVAKACDIPGRSARRYRRVFKEERHDVVRPVPVGDKKPLTGDWVIVGDVHFPYADDNALALFWDVVAQCPNIRQCIIGGDLISADAFSTFAQVSPDRFPEEIELARRFIAQAHKHFDRVVFLMGNHEYRIMKRTGGQISPLLLATMLDPSGKMEMYGPQVWVEGRHRWLVVHPGQYSVYPCVVAGKIADIQQANVISGHEHHVGMAMSPSGRYVVVNFGGLFDQDKMEYVSLNPSGRSRMTQGFVILKDEIPHIVTPYTVWQDVKAVIRGVQGA